MKTLRALTTACLFCGMIGCSTTGTHPRTAVYNTRLVYAQTEAPIVTVLAGGRAELEAEIQTSSCVTANDLFGERPTGHTHRVQQLYRIQTPLVRTAAKRLLSHGYTAVVPCGQQ